MKKFAWFPITNIIMTYLSGAFVNSNLNSLYWGFEYRQNMVTYLALTNIIYIFCIGIFLFNKHIEEQERREKELK